MVDPSCWRSRYFAEVVPFGSLQYKVHLPETLAGSCCAGGCWANNVPPAISPRQTKTTAEKYLFTRPPVTLVVRENLQQSSGSFTPSRKSDKMRMLQANCSRPRKGEPALML